MKDAEGLIVSRCRSHRLFDLVRPNAGWAGRTSQRPARNLPAEGARQGRAENGFSLLEVMVAVVVLMLVLIPITNLLLDTTTNALLVRQQETAVSLASNTVENEKAIGLSALFSASIVGCQKANSGNTTCTDNSATTCSSSVIVLTAATATQCFIETVDKTIYTIDEYLTSQESSAGSPAGPVAVTVVVNWNLLSKTHTFTTTSEIGEG